MTKIFVIDTSVLVAIIDSKDTWHSQATSIQSALIESDIDLVYLDPVINETIGLLGRRLAEQSRHSQFLKLLAQLQSLVPANKITWISHRAEHIYADIVALIEQNGGDLNFHDALISLICRELTISHIISFDRDFDAIPWLQRISSAEQVLQLDSAK